MAENKYDNIGRGALFSNKKKTSDSQPDWRGSVMLSRDYAAGEEVKLGGWTKESRVGPIISLKENNWAPPDSGNKNPTPSKRATLEDDDIPY
jgi:hypothetical protein